MVSIIVGSIIGSVTTTTLLLVMAAIAATKKANERGGCPTCGMPVPVFRKPTSLRQALKGGWTCSGCGTEMDRFGSETIGSVNAK